MKTACIAGMSALIAATSVNAEERNVPAKSGWEGVKPIVNLRLRSESVEQSYHHYDSQRLSLDYGSEADLQLQAKWRHFTGLLKYTDYDAQAFATDTRKLWAQIEYVL